MKQECVGAKLCKIPLYSSNPPKVNASQKKMSCCFIGQFCQLTSIQKLKKSICILLSRFRPSCMCALEPKT